MKERKNLREAMQAKVENEYINAPIIDSQVNFSVKQKSPFFKAEARNLRKDVRHHMKRTDTPLTREIYDQNYPLVVGDGKTYAYHPTEEQGSLDEYFNIQSKSMGNAEYEGRALAEMYKANLHVIQSREENEKVNTHKLPTINSNDKNTIDIYLTHEIDKTHFTYNGFEKDGVFYPYSGETSDFENSCLFNAFLIFKQHQDAVLDYQDGLEANQAEEFEPIDPEYLELGEKEPKIELLQPGEIVYIDPSIVDPPKPEPKPSFFQDNPGLVEQVQKQQADLIAKSRTGFNDERAEQAFRASMERLAEENFDKYQEVKDQIQKDEVLAIKLAAGLIDEEELNSPAALSA